MWVTGRLVSVRGTGKAHSSCTSTLIRAGGSGKPWWVALRSGLIIIARRPATVGSPENALAAFGRLIRIPFRCATTIIWR